MSSEEKILEHGIPLSLSAEEILPSQDINQLASGASVSLFGKFAGRGLDMLRHIALARLLGVGQYGLYSLGWTIFQMIGQFAPLGLNSGVIYFGTRYWPKNPKRLKGVIYQSMGVSLFAGLGFGTLLFFIAPWVATRIFSKPDLSAVLRLVAVTIPLMVGLRVAASASRVSRNMKYAVYAQDVVQGGLALFLGTVFIWFGWGLNGAMVAGLLAFGGAFFLSLVYLKRLFPQVFSSQVKPEFVGRELLTYSLPLSLIAIFQGQMGIAWIGRLFLGAFYPASYVGVFQAVSQANIYFSFIINSFSDIFAPMAATLHHRMEIKRLEEIYRLTTRWGLYICIPTFLVFGFAPREFLIVLFGVGYGFGATALIILSLGQLVNVGTGSFGLLLVMNKHMKKWWAISVGSLVTNLFLSWFLVPLWGIVGAAWASSLGVILMNSLGVIITRYYVGVWPYDRSYIKGLRATVVTVIALILFSFAPIEIPLLRLGFVFILAFGIFAGVLFILGLEEEDYQFFQTLFQRFKTLKNGNLYE
jgi:O-antigen/teichoic acid export membrane protein